MISKNVYAYCKEDISLIENYDLAVNDQKQTWHCHHRLETDLLLTTEELKSLNLYFNRPANELILLTLSEHSRIHALVSTCAMHAKEAQEKRLKTVSLWSDDYRLDINNRISESKKGQEPWNKGIPSTESTCKKLSESHKNIYQDYLWMKKDTEETRIYKDDLDKYINLGYIPGRYYEVSHASHPSPHKGKICINNGVTNMYIKEENLEYYLNKGYKQGHLGKTRNGIPPTNKGYKYMTDGISEPVLLSPDEWGEFIDIGYHFGLK